MGAENEDYFLAILVTLFSPTVIKQVTIFEGKGSFFHKEIEEVWSGLNRKKRQGRLKLYEAEIHTG